MIIHGSSKARNRYLSRLSVRSWTRIKNQIEDNTTSINDIKSLIDYFFKIDPKMMIHSMTHKRLHFMRMIIDHCTSFDDGCTGDDLIALTQWIKARTNVDEQQLMQTLRDQLSKHELIWHRYFTWMYMHKDVKNYQSFMMHLLDESTTINACVIVCMVNHLPEFYATLVQRFGLESIQQAMSVGDMREFFHHPGRTFDSVEHLLFVVDAFIQLFPHPYKGTTISKEMKNRIWENLGLLVVDESVTRQVMDEFRLTRQNILHHFAKPAKRIWDWMLKDDPKFYDCLMNDLCIKIDASMIESYIQNYDYVSGEIIHWMIHHKTLRQSLQDVLENLYDNIDPNSFFTILVEMQERYHQFVNQNQPKECAVFDFLHQTYPIDSFDIDEMVHCILKCGEHVNVMLQWVDQNIGSLANHHPSLEGGHSFTIWSKEAYDFIRQRSRTVMIDTESFELWKIVRHDPMLDNDMSDFIDNIFTSFDKDLTREMWMLAQQKHVGRNGACFRSVFKDSLNDFIDGDLVNETNDPMVKDYVMFLVKDLFINGDDDLSKKMKRAVIEGCLNQNDRFDILDEMMRNGLIDFDFDSIRADENPKLNHNAQIWMNWWKNW